MRQKLSPNYPQWRDDVQERLMVQAHETSTK